MLAPFFLSIVITMGLAATAWVAGAFWRRGKPPLPYFVFFGVVLTFVLFLPVCMGVGYLHSVVWYRDFHYTTPPEVTDGLSLPPGSRDITRRRGYALESYRFEVSEAEVVRWFSDLKNRYRDGEAFLAETPTVSNELTSEIKREMEELRAREVRAYFGYTGRPLPGDLKFVGGVMLAENGAGIRLYYSATEGRAYFQFNRW